MKKERFLEKLNNGAISGAYLIHGDEDFFKEAAIRTAQELIPEDLRAFNLTVLYEPDVAKLSEICETMPLFMEKTLVIARSSRLDIAFSRPFLRGQYPTAWLVYDYFYFCSYSFCILYHYLFGFKGAYLATTNSEG